MWDLAGSGIKPMSLALAGGFFITEPPGKPWREVIILMLLVHFSSNQWTSLYFITLVQALGCVRLFVTPWTAARQASLSIINSQSLLKLMFIESVMTPNHLILCLPFLLLPSIFPSIRVFSSESVLCIGWPKYWSFSFSMSPSNEYSGLISFRMDWLDLLAVQRTHKNPLQQHKSKASILQCSAFFIVQSWHAVVHGVAKSRHNWATELIPFSIVAARIFQHCPSIPFFPHPYQHLLLSFWQ